MTRTGFLGDLLAQLVERRFMVPVRGAGDRPMGDLCAALMSGRGEVSTMRRAREILARYRALDAAGGGPSSRCWRIPSTSTPSPCPSRGRLCAASGRRDAGACGHAAEPRRQELFRRLNHAPGATAELVRMRRDLLGLIREMPELARVDLDFEHLFASWFNRGFLVLRQITWESPARLLEKIIDYEAVHEIGDWEALRARIDPPDRRCFAFFHPAMPDEPLIFVQVALVKGCRSVQSCLPRIALSWTPPRPIPRRSIRSRTVSRA
jgi:malonyl-CoA decarboxylase